MSDADTTPDGAERGEGRDDDWPEWVDDYVEDIASRFEKGGIGMHDAYNIPQVILDECADRLRTPQGEGDEA